MRASSDDRYDDASCQLIRPQALFSAPVTPRHEFAGRFRGAGCSELGEHVPQPRGVLSVGWQQPKLVCGHQRQEARVYRYPSASDEFRLDFPPERPP